VEPLFQLNHVFGSVGDWFYLQGTRRRPTILTMAALSAAVDKTLLDWVDRFVVEYPAGEQYLKHIGVASDRIRLIYPPVDLDRFTPEPCNHPFTVLFASSPENESWLEARGVHLVWTPRPCGPGCNSVCYGVPGAAALRDCASGLRRGHSQTSNWSWVACRHAFSISAGACHCALFTRLDKCKPAPNSLIESLASGRPVVSTPIVGMADLIRDEGAGRDGESKRPRFG
jgi:hypothetical protein